MVRFNPGSISTVGNEWRAWLYDGGTLAPAAALLRSTANETINSILLPHTMAGSTQQAIYGKVWCDIYNVTDLGIGEATVTYTYLPNQDITVSAMYYQALAGVVTGPVNDLSASLYQYINDLTNEGRDFAPDLAETDYVQTQATGSARFAFDTASLPAGRVLSIQLEIRYYARSTAGGSSCGVDLCEGSTTVQRLATLNVTGSGQDPPLMGTLLSQEFYTNPATREPWMRSDILSFDGGGVNDLSIQLSGIVGTVKVMAVRLKVKTISEKRVACGASTETIAPASLTVNTTNACILKTPAGADNWSKATATNYLVVMSQLTHPSIQSQLQYYWRVDSGQVNPDNQGHVYAVTLDASGRLLSAVGPQTAAYGVIVALTTGALSVDTQPYWQMVAGRVYTGVTATQRITTHGSTTYQTIRAVIGRLPATAPDANLTFRVKRVSDNVAMGGTATLTPAQLAEHPLLGSYLGVTWYDVQLDLSSNATLVSGTSYYVEAVSTAAQATPWYLYALDETADYTFTADQSFGGTTAYATLNGATQLEMDLVLTLTVPPPAGPASITLSTVSYTLPDNGGAMCAAGVHSAARVLWAATSEGVLFSHYEVQRSEDAGVSWTTIKRVRTESLVTFDDVTAARDVTLKYRVRTVRTTGLASAWRTQSNTTTLVTNAEAVVFATNYDPALTVGYVWLNPQHRYEFLSDREVNVVQMHNRNFSVVYRGTEDRGTLHTLDLLIYARNTEVTLGGSPPGSNGDDAFDALRAIAESDGPNVVVFTPFGKRIFGAVRVPGGDLEAEAALYTCTVQVVQTSAVDAITEL